MIISHSLHCPQKHQSPTPMFYSNFPNYVTILDLFLSSLMSVSGLPCTMTHSYVVCMAQENWVLYLPILYHVYVDLRSTSGRCLVRQNIMTSSNWNIFRVTGHLCGEFTGDRWIPAQRPVTRSFDVFFDLRLYKRLSKQSWGWWFETSSRPLRRHSNEKLL